MPAPRLSVVVTRRLPEVVETRMKELFDVTLRETDEKMTREELVAAMQRAHTIGRGAVGGIAVLAGRGVDADSHGGTLGGTGA